MAAYSKTKHTMHINNQLMALLICDKVGREKVGRQLTKFLTNMRIIILLRVDLSYGIADIMRVDHITFYTATIGGIHIATEESYRGEICSLSREIVP